jgi:hypothetical protein
MIAKLQLIAKHAVAHLHEIIIALAVEERSQLVVVLALGAAFLAVMAIQVAFNEE